MFLSNLGFQVAFCISSYFLNFIDKNKPLICLPLYPYYKLRWHWLDTWVFLGLWFVSVHDDSTFKLRRKKKISNNYVHSAYFSQISTKSNDDLCQIDFFSGYTCSWLLCKSFSVLIAVYTHCLCKRCHNKGSQQLFDRICFFLTELKYAFIKTFLVHL